MACHPDLVLRSKTNGTHFVPADEGEGIVCRLCNDVAEDAIQSTCRHIFDRECIKNYLSAAGQQKVELYLPIILPAHILASYSLSAQFVTSLSPSTSKDRPSIWKKMSAPRARVS
jgi:hypothetical protein